MPIIKKGKESKVSNQEKKVKGYERSGLSQREYCKKEGISLSSLTKWRRKFRNPAEKNMTFVELQSAKEESPINSAIEVIISERLKLRAQDNINAEKLAVIVNALLGIQ